MDFWIGDWSVKVRSRTDPASETWVEQAGSNHVTSTLGGCVIEEHFTASGGAPGTWTGRSVSMWMARERRWRQTWVDDSGSYLAFTGGMEKDWFVLTGEPQPTGRVMRMVFAGITPREIHWRWEASVDQGKTWRSMMTIDYTRLK